jgi:molybdopterin converting factor small subunit
MNIKVKIYATLRYYLPATQEFIDGSRLEIPEGSTVGQIPEMLHFPKKVSVMFVLNGSGADKNAVLKEGDMLHIVPPMVGG